MVDLAKVNCRNKSICYRFFQIKIVQNYILFLLPREKEEEEEEAK